MTATDGFKYVGKGDVYNGVPPRDITKEEYDALPPIAQRVVDVSGAYEPMKAQTKADDKAGKEG